MFRIDRPLGFVAMFLPLYCATSALAVVPSEVLLPATTKGYASTFDVEQLETSFNKTQLGQLLQDPVMQPFTEDLKQQLRNKWGRISQKFGLTMEDLEGVPGGEASLAMIQPAPNEAAVAMVVDVTGHMDEANAMLAKVDRNLTKENAKKSEKTVLGATITTYVIPPDEGQTEPEHAVFFINDNMLCAADNQAVAEAMLGRFSGEPTDNLASVPAFRTIMARAAAAAGGMVPEIRWFLEPFGYIECARASDPTLGPKQGKDLFAILSNQGFRAVQGVGGYVNFYVDDRYEILHRSFASAPAVEGAPEGEKYTLAARMLQFPNGGTLHPPAWVPRELATYLSFNWKMQEAFEYSKTLVDEVVGEEGVFEDVIRSIQEDPNGPQIDLRKDLVAYIGTRATLITDYALPITPKCERTVIALETTNEQSLAATIEKTMQSDPNAHRREFAGYVIWEIIDEEDDLPELKIEGPNFNPIGVAPEEEEEKKKLPNSAVCVAHGNLFIATHIEFLQKVLVDADARETLPQSVDYQLVMDEITKLTQDENSFRVFSRTDEEFRPTYELIRAGRMPEAETMLGKALNSLFGEGEEGELRQQRIDGHSLPDFEMVRRYFGPAGISVKSEADGWFIQGILLSKETP